MNQNEKKIFDMPIKEPTQRELFEMRLFSQKYKQAHPKASKREIRRATQRKFDKK